VPGEGKIGNVFHFVVIALMVGVAALLLDRLALWAERRGWMYYRHRKPSGSSLGSAFLEVQTLLEPGKRHVAEVQRQEATEQDEQGDPPPESEEES
jgi:hypothetical protein